MPNGLARPSCTASKFFPINPNWSKFLSPVTESSTRIATFSPSGVGNVETRKSISRSNTFARNRPSCGTLASSILRLEITFRRLNMNIRCSALDGLRKSSRHNPDNRRLFTVYDSCFFQLDDGAAAGAGFQIERLDCRLNLGFVRRIFFDDFLPVAVRDEVDAKVEMAAPRF